MFVDFLVANLVDFRVLVGMDIINGWLKNVGLEFVTYLLATFLILSVCLCHPCLYRLVVRRLVHMFVYK